MAAFWVAVKEGGPWSLLLLALVGFVYAMARGHLVRGAEIDRIERRIEKDTDRVLDLYREQIKTLVEAHSKKDATIATQDEQIGKLLASTEVSSAALDKIVKEADRRGFFQA